MKILLIFYLIITIILTFFNNLSFKSKYNKIDIKLCDYNKFEIE